MFISNAIPLALPLLYGSKIMPYMILWKNKFFNYFQAAKLSTEVNQLANAHKKIDAWSAFAMTGLGHNLEDLAQHTYSGTNPLNQELIAQQTTDFINNYKMQKIKHLVDTVGTI